MFSVKRGSLSEKSVDAYHSVANGALNYRRVDKGARRVPQKVVYEALSYFQVQFDKGSFAIINIYESVQGVLFLCIPSPSPNG